MLVRRPRPGADDLPVSAEPERFLAAGLDVVLECAGHQAVRDHGVRCLEAGADLVLTSIGALVDEALRARLYAAAETTGRRLVIASAGIGALDILAAAAVGGLERVVVTVRKDPSAWYGTEAERLCDLGALSAPLTSSTAACARVPGATRRTSTSAPRPRSPASASTARGS